MTSSGTPSTCKGAKQANSVPKLEIGNEVELLGDLWHLVWLEKFTSLVQPFCQKLFKAIAQSLSDA